MDEWFDAVGLIKKDSCPTTDQLLVYANSLPRTIDTGKNFVKGAFPDCDITVHNLEEVGKMDNTFNPIVRSPVDDAFVAKAEKSIDDMLGEGGFAKLNERLAKKLPNPRNRAGLRPLRHLRKRKTVRPRKNAEQPHLRAKQRTRYQRPAA